MGTQSFINQDFQTQRGQNAVHPVRLKTDVIFIVAVAFLLVIGLLMVYSASWQYTLWNDLGAGYILVRQLIWLAVGTVAAVIISRIDYHRFQKWALPLMGLTILLLLAVLIVGDNRNNSTRTLFNGSIQPSELAKLIVIIYLSVWLYSKQDQLNSIFLGLLPMMMILGITGSLVAVQPDVSASITIVLLGGVLFYLADGDLRQIVLVVAVSVLIGWLIINVNPTGRNRIGTYLAGQQNLADASPHIIRSVEAIVRGGVLGAGIGKSETKFTGLPFPWTDSIFTVIIEETGLLGALVVIGLFLIVMWRGLVIAAHAPDSLGKLLAGGVTMWIILEATINMGVMVNLFPFAGNALPLISSGGSSMVSVLVGIGIILSVAHQSKETETKEGSVIGAVVDLRRRDRRGRISRSVCPANPEE